MSNDIDRSLLDRLNALRGNETSSSGRTAASTKVDVDLIERKPAAPSREDALAARLKSLRHCQDEDTSSSPSTKSPQKQEKQSSSSAAAATTSNTIHNTTVIKENKYVAVDDDDDVDAMFQTDDQTLQELLEDVAPEEGFAADPVDDAQVKALLEDLSRSIPQEGTTDDAKGNAKEMDDDDSDGEDMIKATKEIMDRLRDETELEEKDGKEWDDNDNGDDDDDNRGDGLEKATLDLPSVPSDLAATSPSENTKSTTADLDDITARMAALRANTDPLSLPSVPTSKPSGKPINRLTTKTGYTDDDVDSWCTVCLEDATLRCLGCDDDVYCLRCWREMHVGPAAAFDDRTHNAVQFTKDRKKEEKKVTLGA